MKHKKFVFLFYSVSCINYIEILKESYHLLSRTHERIHLIHSVRLCVCVCVVFVGEKLFHKLKLLRRRHYLLISFSLYLVCVCVCASCQTNNNNNNQENVLNWKCFLGIQYPALLFQRFTFTRFSSRQNDQKRKLNYILMLICNGVKMTIYIFTFFHFYIYFWWHQNADELVTLIQASKQNNNKTKSRKKWWREWSCRP